MIATWMLYGIATSFLLALAALAADRAARLLRWPLRWTWTACLWGSVLGPAALMYSARGARGPGGAETTLDTPRANMPGLARIVIPTPTAPRAVFSFDALDRPLLVGWLLASLAVSTGLAIGLLSLARARRRWHAEIVSGTRVLISPDVGPAVGVFGMESIVLPEWTLAAEPELQRLMLLHEQEHVRARDPHVLVQALVPLVLFPWNLPLWWQVKRLRLAIEMDCDARVLQRNADVAAYGELLLEVGRRAARRARISMAAFSEGRTSLEARIRMMTNSRPRHYLPIAVALAVSAALPLVATGAIPRPSFRLPNFAAPRLVASGPQDGTALLGAAPTPGGQVDSTLKHWLRNLVVTQEKYYSEHGTYTTDVSALGLFTPPRQALRGGKPDSIYVEVIQAGGRSWWGRASLRGHRGKSCIIWVGTIGDFAASPTTDADKIQARNEGEPVCDEF